METSQQPPPLNRLPTLKITSNSTPAGDSAPPTPSQGKPKIRVITKSQPSTPADTHPPSFVSRPGVAAAANGARTISAVPKPTQTKAGRISKPSAKKRTRDDSEDDDEDVPLANG